jgi:ATP-dependent DNA ligase
MYAFILEMYKVKAEEKVLMDTFKTLLESGYEGLIIRDLDCGYEFKKSRQFLKWKPMIDAEFPIVGFKQSITGDTLGSLLLQAPNGKTFYCDLKGEIGTDEYKKKIWDNQDSYKGLYVTADFLEWTEDGVPRNAKAGRFRTGKSID